MINLLTRIELFRALTPSEIDMNFMDIERTVNEISNLLGSANSVEIVNNLTTGGTTKALSAEQGKVLQSDKYPILRNGTGDITDPQIVQTLAGIGFSLSGANLGSVYLEFANFQNANLSYAKLEFAYLGSANFQNANLSYANLGSANLNGAYLGSANLSYAKLEFAYLSYANLGSANLNGAYLGSANLNGATGLNSDINVALANVSKDVFGDGTTIWTLTWTNGNTYQCDPATGLFTQQ